MIRIFTASAVLTALIISSCSPKAGNVVVFTPPTIVADTVKGPLLTNAVDSFSYAAGISIANSMKAQGVPSLNTDLMSMAMQSIYGKDSTLMTNEMADQTLQEKIQMFMTQKAEAEKAKTAAFFAENKLKPGVVSLESGLQYKVITEGNPAAMKPGPTDTVEVHYEGSLVDGTIFDSSIKRGETIKFPVNGVIKGWTQILQLMPKGSKWKVWIPSELGYGERGTGGAIPGNAMLIFDIDLINVMPAKAK